MPGLIFIDGEVRMPIMRMPVRTTVIEVGTGRVMFSPGSMLTPEQLASAGEITDIVAPSFWHTDGGPRAAAVHPKARLWGPPGMGKRRPGHSWSVLGEDPWPHESELHLLPLAGMPGVREHALYHGRSRSLLVVDLFFNIEEPQGWGAWLILGPAGTYRRFGCSRLFTLMVKDRAAFSASLAPFGRLDVDQIIPAHGAIVSGEAKRRLVAALRERKIEIPSS